MSREVARMIGVELVALAAGLGALSWLLTKVYRVFKFGERAFVELVGAPGQPSLRETLDEVKLVALRSERELHPNGGGSLRDEVRGVSRQVTAAADLAETATVHATTLTARLEQIGVEAHDERADLRERLTTMRQDITEEMVRRTADAFELIAEHGGPDLRMHGLIEHVHPLTPPSTTGPSIQPPAERPTP